MPGGSALQTPRRLTDIPAGRLLVAIGIALVLAVVIPAALYGAISIQKLVEALQAQA
jgi:hypothetical protein